jgi:hypothetical protein
MYSLLACLLAYIVFHFQLKQGRRSTPHRSMLLKQH